MKHHVVLKLRAPLASGLAVPEWTAFAEAKPIIFDRALPEIDAIFDAYGRRFWLTREYRPASLDGWSSAEILHALDRTYRLILQDDGDLPPGLIERIRLVPSVEEARGLAVGTAPLPDTAPLATTASMRKPADLIWLGYAKAMTTGRPDVRIAVLDTGVDLEHPELRGRIVAGADFVDLRGMDTTAFVGDLADVDDVPQDEVGHGTHVAGIIGARGERMDEGVAPGCSLMAVRVLATMRKGDRLVGAGVVDNINPAIKWAADHDADVINMSLGIKHEGGGLPHEDVIRYAISRNVTVVAASGNDGGPSRYYPGALPGVIAVGAVDGDGQPTSFTSFGAHITVAAPGVAIHSAFAHRSYAVASGTSQASPFVAGGIGLLKSYARERGSELTATDVTGLLRHTADRVDARARTERAGFGVLNLADAFALLAHNLN